MAKLPQVMLETLIEKLKKAPFFAISIDESAAIDGIEYLSIEVFYMGEDGTAQNSFLKLHPITDLTAPGISSAVVKSCSSVKLIAENSHHSF